MIKRMITKNRNKRRLVNFNMKKDINKINNQNNKELFNTKTVETSKVNNQDNIF